LAEPFLAEIRIMSFNFPPKGWAQCTGQLMPINQNQALFSLLGTTYGGDGRVNFALPDCRGRVPIHLGSTYILGQKGGETAHTVNMSEMPLHAHMLMGTSNNGSAATAAGNVFGVVAGRIYTDPKNTTTLQGGTVTTVGGSQPHENMGPYLTLNFCIALQGIFPSQN